MATMATAHPIPALVVGPALELEAMLPPRLPIEVDRSATAAEALARVARTQYRLVLIDHTAEGDVTEEQLAYLRALHAMRPGAKAIVLVSHSTARKVIESLRHGLSAYFTRPFDPGAVRDAIEQVLSLPGWGEDIELISAAPAFLSLRLRCSLHTAEKVAQFLKELPCELTDEERAETAMGLREMLLNAIEHGGKFDPGEWVRVTRVRTRRAIVYHIEDPGAGFSMSDLKHAAISNPPDQPTAHMDVRDAENRRPGGFGMLITGQSVDEVIYSQKGNEVILVKHLV